MRGYKVFSTLWKILYNKFKANFGRFQKFYRLRSCSAFYLNELGAISEITPIAFLLSLLTQRTWVKVWHLTDCVDAQAIYQIILIISSDESRFYFAWFIEFTSKNLLRGYSVSSSLRNIVKQTLWQQIRFVSVLHIPSLRI